MTRLWALLHEDLADSASPAVELTTGSVDADAVAGDKKWFGVSASVSFESVEIWVKGRLFRIPSISMMIVLKVS